MAQRRNRRKTRTVSEHAILALHKYYLRAEHMRGQFRDARDRLVAKHGAEALKIRTPTTERFQVEMYLDYWYAGIFAAMEGYEKLALTDPKVEKLRVRSYRKRLLERPSFARAVDEARQYRPLFPLGAPDRD